MGDVQSKSSTSTAAGGHGEWFFDELQKMRSEGVLVDVTLCAEGEEIPCHRLVLATVSDYFRSMFSGGLIESQKSKIEMGGVSAEALQLLVHYAYTSKVNITPDNVQSLFQAADMLQFYEVCNKCEKFLHGNVNEKTCLGIWTLADRVSRSRLAETAKSCSLKWFEKVCTTEDFLHLPVHLLQSYISDEGLLAKKEERILEVVMLWVRHDLKEREEHLKELLKCICFTCMDPDYLKNILKTDKLLAGVRGIKTMVKKQPTHAVSRQILQKDILVLGGVTGTEHTLSGKAYRLELDSTCVDTSPLPKPFRDSRGIAACVIRNNLVVTGGDKSMSQAWRYKASKNTWMKMANLRTRRYDHGMAVLGGEVYVVGGAKNVRARPDDDEDDNDRCMITDVEVYDKERNCWRVTEPLPLAVCSFGITTCRGKLYVFGGWTNEDDDPEETTDAIQCFDPTMDEMWSLEMWMPERVTHISACTVDSKIYLVGGHLQFVVFFDPEDGSCTALAPKLAPWNDCSATVCGSDIYITGGGAEEFKKTGVGKWQSKFHTFAMVQCYNVENNTMVLCKDLPQPLYGHCTVAVSKSKFAKAAEK
ncbi:kelch-like protein 6 [Branchiostoma floridae]|uniref:Kelch-like protein 6 n=1 Tax=Branchiostoma floridae TaxID=7739 RepID=A0A9J7L616_BRAFL|nr:kelch-like protein 6 [Branchiostoma floridae]